MGKKSELLINVVNSVGRKLASRPLWLSHPASCTGCVTLLTTGE